jgi:NADH-quinone oxidoreductase subunit K
MILYLTVSSLLFFFGFLGVYLSRNHIIIILISLELIILAANFNFLVFSIILDDLMGQVYSLVILVLAASETAIGLAIIIMYYRMRGGIYLHLVNILKG